MKLSFKFFVMAYIIVLLSTGLGGMLLIRYMTATLWDARVQTVQSAEVYAVDSFLSYADMVPSALSESQCVQLGHQIAATIDSAIEQVAIEPLKEHHPDYQQVSDNEGTYVFSETEGTLTMEAACRVNAGTAVYIVRVTSDFTQVRQQCRALWQSYGVTVLCLSAVSGLLIWLLTKSVTRPLGRLAASAQRIAAGEYGETVSVGSHDREIIELSDSFNGMSTTIAQKIDEITGEVEKRERFVADFAHEMKTPMTAIVGYAQMLHRYDLDEAERRQAAEAIYKEGKRLEKLSLQMLDWSVYRQGNAQLAPLSLRQLATTLEATLRVLGEKYALSFTVDFGEGTVIADEVLLLSLLYNLADNAFKASSVMGISLYSEAREKGIALCVRDCGSGIAPENIARLTEPFFREDISRSRAQGGAGLGLAICKQIAALHGTSLHFDSVQGAGTIVSFVLEKGGETT